MEQSVEGRRSQQADSLLLILHYVCRPASPLTSSFLSSALSRNWVTIDSVVVAGEIVSPSNKLLRRKRDTGHQWQTSQDRYLQYLHNVRYADLLPLYLT